MNGSRPMSAELLRQLTRRNFLKRTSYGLGAVALAALLDPAVLQAKPVAGHMGGVHFPARARRVIYLFQSGGPSHLDLLDYKPVLKAMNGKEMPKSVMGTQRVTLMTRGQGKFLAVGSPFEFRQHGQSGAWVSELLPHTAKLVDDLCIMKNIHTEPINHDPAVTFMQTGSMVPGRPCMGSWVNYGLGTDNSDLPGFVVLLSGVTDQPILPRYYNSGWLPSQYQGVQFQGTGDPVLFLTNPKGIDRANNGQLIDTMNQLNGIRRDALLDPEIQTRIDAFELAFRMQASVPELTDVSGESPETMDSYGPDVRKPGTYAANCLLARRLVERGVRFVQLYHAGWDQHGDLPQNLKRQTMQTDQPTAALLGDLKRRGMLDDTLVIWGGEFGRTSFCQGALRANFGRDHHPRCFTVWMAGGGVKGGQVIGNTDDYGYNLAGEGIHVHDLHATILHCLGINHERLTYRFQGRDFRLTDVSGRVVKEILA